MIGYSNFIVNEVYNAPGSAVATDYSPQHPYIRQINDAGDPVLTHQIVQS